jgi:hypothetical protein
MLNPKNGTKNFINISKALKGDLLKFTKIISFSHDSNPDCGVVIYPGTLCRLRTIINDSFYVELLTEDKLRPTVAVPNVDRYLEFA